MKFNLPVIILNNALLMPECEIKLEFDDEISKSIIDEAELFHDNKLFIITRFSTSEKILLKDLPNIGTIALIEKKLLLPNGKVRVTLKGIKRAKVIEYLNPTKDSLECFVSTISKENINEDIKMGFIRKLYNELDNYILKVPYMSNSMLSSISNTNDLSKITDIIVSEMPIDNKKKLTYLYELSSIKRVEMLLEDMYKEQQLYNIEQNIDTKVQKELEDDQKNFYLKEKIKQLQNEIGEISPKQEEIQILREKIDNLNANEIIKEKLLNELSRYERMPEVSLEINGVRNYIDVMLNIPWNITTNDIEDINEIKNNLDKNHYGINEVKDRIIEYLIVKKQSQNLDTPIICLVGPPGVGKTTLAMSIAKSMGRNFVKISVGGVDDEAIIKGHTRAYIGSTPGKIIDSLIRAKSSNPVFLIDEIDKMSSNYKGDPKSALLEVLDSSQNNTFKDNYIEEEYDLSKVLFITTANNINDIPSELKDRLEIIKISGYTELEKIDIARNYLIPIICEKHGIKDIKISDSQLLIIIRNYTKESGVRELYRLLSKIVRKIIFNKIIDNKRINLNVSDVTNYLGNYIYNIDVINSDIGICNALAYTDYGGDIIQVETNYYMGSGNIILTGSMGDTTLESCKIALSYIKSNYEKFNIDKKIFTSDIHINIPNISIKKEGPSAGCAITTSIISTLSNLKINNKYAFTGEITLRGNIMPVGGLKEKILGAYINNIDTIFIPFLNLNDLNLIPEEIKNKIKFIPVKKYTEIYEYILGE